MTPDTLKIQETIFMDRKTFIPAEKITIPESPCVASKRPQPTLTAKDDDLFLVTDTMRNISGCSLEDGNPNVGLFCCDTRFLSRLELPIAGRSPILLSSSAQKGISISVLRTNPKIYQHLKAETVGIRREIVLNGAQWCAF